MRFSCYCLIAIALILFTSCDATSGTSDQAKQTVVATNSLHSASLLTTDDNQKRILRSLSKTVRSDAFDKKYDAKVSDSDNANEEERALLPSGLATQLQSLKTPGLPASVTSLFEKLKTEGFSKTTLDLIKKLDVGSQPTKIKKFLIEMKEMFRTYLRNAYWNTRFVIWMKKKYTPETMYYKLNVRETTGMYDKNYRIYNDYFRTYEHFYGPAFDPRHVYGPKVDSA